MFEKGNKFGNGRPSIPDELKTKLKDGLGECVDFWFNTLRDPEQPWSYRDKSAEKIAAYGYGKPKEMIEIEHIGEPVESYEETLRQIDELLAKRGTAETTEEG
jgi:hypothetical protein